MRKVGKGDLSARNKLPSVKGKLGRWPRISTTCLIRFRSRARAYAEELNQRVENAPPSCRQPEMEGPSSNVMLAGRDR